MNRDWPLWEVFVRSRGGLSHKHVGSVHAPDAELAVRHARDTYTRRMEGVSDQRTLSPPIPTRRGRCSPPLRTRSIGTRLSTTSPTS